MNSKIVVGVGNIYANEALFLAGINPKISVSRISLKRYEKLACSIQRVLEEAINAGGTTLRDFTGGDGSPGYFQSYEKNPCNRRRKINAERLREH